MSVYNDFVKCLCTMYEKHGERKRKTEKKKELNKNNKLVGYALYSDLYHRLPTVFHTQIQKTSWTISTQKWVYATWVQK